MKSNSMVEVGATLFVQDIGGINETTVELTPGVNVLKGRNATNRTSFFRAIMAALGSDNVAIKGDADKGHVELTLNGDTYNRTITREEHTIKTEGNPYLSDSTVADLFAFLLEDNEVRRTVARDGDLHDIIMRPVDTNKIEQEITVAEQRKDSLDDQISEMRSQKERLPDLRSQQKSLKDELADKQTKLVSIQKEIESLENDSEETQDQQERFKEHLENLNEIREDLNETCNRLESEQEQYEALKEEREKLRSERSNLPTSFKGISDLGQQIGELQERKRALGSLLDRLQNIIQFNQEMVENTESELREELMPEDRDITDQLLADQTLICWTCGSHVDSQEIETTLEDLRNFRQEKMSERKEISENLDRLRDQKQEMEKHQQRREQIEQQLENIDNRIDQQSKHIKQLQDQREALNDHIAELEREVTKEEPDIHGNDRILELNKRENELKTSIEALGSDLEDIQTEITEIENSVSDISDKEKDREEVKQQLTNLRNRIKNLETEAVESFNNHMSNIIDILGYNNLDRIWIEQRKESSDDRRKRISKTEFDLHVVRSTDQDVIYEDTIDHLSESEREVTGLIFALAGYFVHNVHEEVPFMLLDSLEAIDAGRIAALVEYFKEYADFLVIALLPEDAQSINDTYRKITEI